MSDISLDRQKRILWESITDLERRLRQWRLEWADTYPSGQPFEVHTQGLDNFPTFQYVDLHTMETITPTTFAYPDPQLARTLCMYYAAMILLSSVDTRPVNAIQRHEQFEFACRVCRSMEYYIRTVPGNMINRMAFPLRVTYDILPEGGIERRYVGEVFQLVQRKKMLNSWGKFIPDISTSAKG